MSTQSKWILAFAGIVFIFAMVSYYRNLQQDPSGDVEIGQEALPEKKQRPGWPKTGMANTKAEPGYDAERINLWDSPNGDRELRCELRHLTMVHVVKELGPYAYVQEQRDTTCAGWCMREWISYTP
jgi:hypothetical protein